MSVRKRRSGSLKAAVVVAALLVAPAAVQAGPVPAYEFATPVFGLATAPRGGLLVADAGAGIVRLRNGVGKLIAELPGVTDVAPIRHRVMFAVTGAGGWGLFRVTHGRVRQIADFLSFETNVNPDGGEIDSNPFDVARLTRRRALVADAGGNALLVARRGRVDWIATLPDELVSTSNVKDLVGCPNPAPGFEEICSLPDMIPAQPVVTSVVIGQDGAYYVGELKGFPAPTGESRIWRIERGTRHASCGTDPACQVVADGFTSVVDLSIAPDGTVHVTELDEASWFAVELGFPGLGGTVSACDAYWNCTEVATDLSMPVATTTGHDGTLYAVINALVPGAAEVVALT